MSPDRLWLRFVWLAVLSALIPGFGLASSMATSWLLGTGPGLWHLAAIQTHASALLNGWGGAMILGIALHFLPRLRGVKLIGIRWAVAFFWLLALGLSTRVITQPLLAALAASIQPAAVAWLDVLIFCGIAAQAVAITSLLAILTFTLRAGPPLVKNKGFKQIAPLIIVAASALLLAQIAWCLGASSSLAHGHTLALLPARTQSLAVDLMLFGFVAAVGIAMASRLFPLSFRTRLPHVRGLQWSAGLLGGGVSLSLLRALPSTHFPALANAADWASPLFAAGLLVGIYAVRIFHPRKPVPKGAAPYRIREDPAAVGVIAAYLWLAVAALLLILAFTNPSSALLPIQPNLARHALGLGFMTLLIYSVGWKMLPGFAGKRPESARWLRSAVVLGNLAGLFRVVPSFLPAYQLFGHSWIEWFYPFSGLAALSGLCAFATALWHSLRKAPAAL